MLEPLVPYIREWWSNSTERRDPDEENSNEKRGITEWRDLTVDDVAWIPWETSLARVHPDLNRDGWGFGTEKTSPGDVPENGPEKDKLSGWSPSTSTIPEAPEPESDFRSHRQVANALVETITSGDDGLGIALTGTVGSGKSSIVERMKRELEDDSNTKGVFTYDIWVHRGDSIRRSFIEELAGFLVREQGWIEEKAAERAKRYVLMQETESSSEITILGAIIAILLALLSPSLLLTRAGWWDTFAEHVPVLEKVPTGSLGAVVALGIVIVLVTGIVILALQRGWLRLFGKQGEGPSLLSRETSVTIEEADASTVDFRAAFDTLVGSALREDVDRKLVIVIDNLDRFTPEDVYETWTNLQTFFDLSGSNHSNGEDWRKRFWTILPFSPQAPYRLRGILGGTGDTGKAERPNAWTPAPPPFEEYIDKTFQLRFRVSPPVQSDLEGYFIDQFNDAIQIPDDQDTVAARVRDLFFRFLNDAATPSGSFQPTPRTVNRYLNDLVASVRQHGRTLPVPVQAYFLLLKKKYGDDLDDTKIGKEDELDLRGVRPLVGMREKRLRTQLLMLYHGVPESKVAQILIRGEVRKAIDEGDHRKLESRQDEIGFRGIVRERIQQICARPIGEVVAKAALGFENITSNSLPSQCWQRLAEALHEVEEVNFRDSEIGRGFTVLINKEAERTGEVPTDLEIKVLNLSSTLGA